MCQTLIRSTSLSDAERATRTAMVLRGSWECGNSGKQRAESVLCLFVYISLVNTIGYTVRACAETVIWLFVVFDVNQRCTLLFSESQRRTRLCSYSSIELALFGSSANAFAFRNGDLDLVRNRPTLGQRRKGDRE